MCILVYVQALEDYVMCLYDFARSFHVSILSDLENSGGLIVFMRQDRT